MTGTEQVHNTLYGKSHYILLNRSDIAYAGSRLLECPGSIEMEGYGTASMAAVTGTLL